MFNRRYLEMDPIAVVVDAVRLPKLPQPVPTFDIDATRDIPAAIFLRREGLLAVQIDVVNPDGGIQERHCRLAWVGAKNEKPETGTFPGIGEMPVYATAHRMDGNLLETTIAVSGTDISRFRQTGRFTFAASIIAGDGSTIASASAPFDLTAVPASEPTPDEPIA